MKHSPKVRRPSTPITEKGLRRRNALIVLCFSLVTILFIVLFLSACRIKNVSIDGCEHVDKTSLTEAIDIPTGRHMYAISKDKIAASIKGTSPYIQSVSIRRRLPSTLQIIVEEYEPLYYIAWKEQYYVLSQTLTVLEILPDKESAAAKALCQLTLPEITKAELGKVLVFINKSDLQTLLSILSVLQETGITEQLTTVNLSEKFNLYACYQNKYVLYFGTSENLAAKISRCLSSIIYLTENMYGVKGNIYASAEGETSFVITGTIE